MRKTLAGVPVFAVSLMGVLLGSCRSDDDSPGARGGGPGFRLGNPSFYFKNTASEKQFQKKVGDVKKMMAQLERPLTRFEFNSGGAFEDRLLKQVEPSRLLLADIVRSEADEEESPSLMGSGSVGSVQFGAGFADLDDCSDAIRQVRASYKQSLDSLREQFKYLEQIERSAISGNLLEEAENDDAELEDEAGDGTVSSGVSFKPIKKSDAALAYAFSSHEGGSNLSGEILGSADETRVRFEMNAQGEIPAGSDEDSEWGAGELDGDDWSNGSGGYDWDGYDWDENATALRGSSGFMLDNAAQTVEISSISVADLKAQQIASQLGVKVNQGQNFTSLGADALISGGEQAGVELRMIFAAGGPQMSAPVNFNMTLGALVKSDNELVLTLKSSGVEGKTEQESVPALNLTYSLVRDANGSCAISDNKGGTTEVAFGSVR